MDSIGFRGSVATVKRVCKCISYQKVRQITRVRPLVYTNRSRKCLVATGPMKRRKALLGIWGAANVQAQLNVVSRKKVVYERVVFLLLIMKYRKSGNFRVRKLSL